MKRVAFFDVTEREVRLSVFDVRGSGYALAEKRTFPLSDDHSFALDAETDLPDGVYLSLPLRALNFRIVDVPFEDRARVREVLPFELDGKVLGGTESVIFDAVAIGRNDEGHEILAVFIEKKLLKKILEPLQALGIDPLCVTSLELRHALADFSPVKLVARAPLSDDERERLAIEEVRQPTIDLRRGEFSYTRGIEKTKKALRTTAVLLALLVVIGMSDVLFRIWLSSREIAHLKTAMRQTYRDLFPEEKNIVNELHQLKAHVRELEGKEEAMVGVKPLDVFMALARIERDGSRFHEIAIDGKNIVLRGEAASLSAVQSLEEKLRRHFAGVSISESKASAQGKTLFSITVRQRES